MERNCLTSDSVKCFTWSFVTVTPKCGARLTHPSSLSEQRTSCSARRDNIACNNDMPDPHFVANNLWPEHDLSCSFVRRWDTTKRFYMETDHFMANLHSSIAIYLFDIYSVTTVCAPKSQKIIHSNGCRKKETPKNKKKSFQNVYFVLTKHGGKLEALDIFWFVR